MWHQRTSTTASGKQDRWGIVATTKVYDCHLCISSYNGVVGQFDINTGTESGSRIVREWTSPTMTSPLGKPIFTDAIEVYLEGGTTDLDETDAILTVSVSSDAGHTWGPQRERSMGSHGDRFKRLIWNWWPRSSRYQNYRIQYSDEAKIVINRVNVKYANPELRDDLGVPSG